MLEGKKKSSKKAFVEVKEVPVDEYEKVTEALGKDEELEEGAVL